MHLRTYLKTSRQVQARFAARLNPPVSQGLVSHWLCGVTRVTLHYAMQIKSLTDDQVTPQELRAMYKPKEPQHG